MLIRVVLIPMFTTDTAVSPITIPLRCPCGNIRLLYLVAVALTRRKAYKIQDVFGTVYGHIQTSFTG
jgi:hypothetical protein